MGNRAHIPRVFVDAALSTGSTLELGSAKRHHLGNVQRLGAGAAVILFNGDGREYEARIDAADRKHMQLAVGKAFAPLRESPLDITLVQAIARGDRMDIALAKAVELGVTAIQPVFTARGKVKLAHDRLQRKLRHWQQVVESAAEQSGRLIRPPLAPAYDLDTLIARDAFAATERLMLDPNAGEGLNRCLPAQRITLLTGPESGLSEREREAAAKHGWRALSLGPRVLRAETAGMAALAAIQARWGDLG